MPLASYICWLWYKMCVWWWAYGGLFTARHIAGAGSDRLTAKGQLSSHLAVPQLWDIVARC